MSKKARDLRKHYRLVERRYGNYHIDLSEGSWYSLWHTHLDWDGVTSTSLRHRRKHLHYYLRLLDRVEAEAMGQSMPFQAWIFLDSREGYYDAIYLHTENPQVNFPTHFENFEWTEELPLILKDMPNPENYRIGRISVEDGYLYIVQKRGVGLEINCRE